MPAVYLITGASRGIGLETTRCLAARPDAVIYAGARDPGRAEELIAVAEERPNVKVVKLDATSVEDHRAVVELIKSEEGKIDFACANAGLGLGFAAMANEKLDHFRRHFEVNTFGPLLLFQAVRPLLSSGAVFAVVSSTVGQMNIDIELPAGSYGASKAASNFIVVRIGHENKDIVALAIHPGLVATEMGEVAAVALGASSVGDIPGGLTARQSGEAVAALLLQAKEDKRSPTFRKYNGDILQW